MLRLTVAEATERLWRGNDGASVPRADPAIKPLLRLSVATVVSVHAESAVLLVRISVCAFLLETFWTWDRHRHAGAFLSVTLTLMFAGIVQKAYVLMDV